MKPLSENDKIVCPQCGCEVYLEWKTPAEIEEEIKKRKEELTK